MFISTARNIFLRLRYPIKSDRDSREWLTVKIVGLTHTERWRFNDIPGKTPWYSPWLVGAPAALDVSRTTERTELAQVSRDSGRKRERKRETVPLPQRKGGQLAVTRRTCLDQPSGAAAAPCCTASLHRVALAVRSDRAAFIGLRGSLAGLSSLSPHSLSFFVCVHTRVWIAGCNLFDYFVTRNVNGVEVISINIKYGREVDQINFIESSERPNVRELYSCEMWKRHFRAFRPTVCLWIEICKFRCDKFNRSLIDRFLG